MPFLWKKVKNTRISQLVNDHLHNSQKRRDGSSLLVETGFPTSLIDLFIKNRSKLKNPSKKKRRNPQIGDSNDHLTVGSAVPPPPPPSIAGSLTPTHSPLRCPSPLHNLSVLPPPVSEISAVGCVDEMDGGGGRVVGDVNKVLLGVLRIFLVVVLALGTKRLAVGITISAFLLMFLEYVGRHVVVKRLVSRMLRFKEFELDEKSNGVLILKTKSLNQEIEEVVESSKVEEIQPVIEIIDEPQESQVIEKVESESKKKSRKAKIKSKMKKYVTRKFKGSKKQKDLLQRPEEEEADQFNNGGESENPSVSSSASTSCRMYRDEARLSDANTNIVEDIKGHQLEIEAGLTWRHLVLCLIVLIGLLGGRAFALLCTLSWFLVLKLGQKLPRLMNKVKSG